jgi:hypothetical protein
MAQDDSLGETQGLEVFDGHQQVLRVVVARKVLGIGSREADEVFLKPQHVEVVHNQ